MCVCVCVCVRSLYNCYHHWKWTWLPRFKSRTRLYAHHIVLIPLGNV